LAVVVATGVVVELEVAFFAGGFSGSILATGVRSLFYCYTVTVG
jgi:hypothetical protein